MTTRAMTFTDTLGNVFTFPDLIVNENTRQEILDNINTNAPIFAKKWNAKYKWIDVDVDNFPCLEINMVNPTLKSGPKSMFYIAGPYFDEASEKDSKGIPLNPVNKGTVH